MKIAMFAPYFGPDPNRGLPNYYEYWLKSAAANNRIDFFIPTNLNIGKFTKYNNINYLVMTAEEFWNKIQAIVDFPISRDYYKCSEYRIFFGIIFEDILRDYDYWGLTEFDMIYGDILKILQHELKDGAEVIGRIAPLRLIKNTDKLRYMPFAELKGFTHPLTLEVAFSTSYCWYFSEIIGMNVRYQQNGVEITSIDDRFGDISTKYKYLHCIGMRGKWGFNWDHGQLRGYNDRGEQKEFAAIHLQKRTIECPNEPPGDRFNIVPNIIHNDYADCHELNVGTTLYTIKHLCKKYCEMIREHRNAGKDAELITKEVIMYCKENGLISTNPNPLLKPLYAIKQMILWQ